MKKLKDYPTHIISYKNLDYPQKLKNIKRFPVCLFYKGNINILNNKTLAIIGSRKYSEYGKNVAIEMAYHLAKEGFTIVTGGARGIDSFANIGANKAKKPSVIVLGNGLDYIYPPENKELEEEVLNNDGLIITEFFNDIRGNKYTFPNRNRIISGLSDGVLVVEAKEKSGTAITVDYALDQGRDIYSIPGSVLEENCNGTNNLIKQGAKLVTSIQDIIEDFL